jgi:hypothetical protein
MSKLEFNGVIKLVKVWFDEAEKNKVLPLDDRSATESSPASTCLAWSS